MYDTTCSRSECHDKDSSEYKIGQQIKTLITEANIILDEAQQSVENVKQQGVYTIEYEFALKEAQTYIKEVEPIIHTLSEQTIKEYTGKAIADSNKVKEDILKYSQSLRIRKVYLGIAWLFIFSLIVALYIRKRRADRDWENEQSL